MSITSADFRNAAGRFPTGVAIVTAIAADGYRGVTVSSFVSLSLDPPLISVSLAKSLRSLADIAGAETFGVSVLAESEHETAARFSRAGGEKWGAARPTFAPFGTPWIGPYTAAFECGHHASHEAGDHLILVGRVLHLDVREESPLVYFRGQFSKLRNEISHVSEGSLQSSA